jgi:ribosomal protein L18E
MIIIPAGFLGERILGGIMDKKYCTVKALPLSERPYEKCEKSGPSVLSDAELLAVIIVPVLKMNGL